MNIFGVNISRAKASGDAVQSTLSNSAQVKPYEKFQSGARQFNELVAHGLYSNPAVAGCLSVYSMTLSEPPLVAVNDDDEYVYDDPVSLLFAKPNQVMSGALMLSYAGLFCGLSGNAYLYKLRNGRGEVVELHIFNDSQMKAVPGASISSPISHYNYYYSDRTEPLEIPTSDIIHLRGHIPDPSNIFKSISPIQLVSRSIDSGNALDELIYSTLRNHATPNTIVTTREALSEDQANLLRDQWKDKFSLKPKLTRETVAFLPIDMEVQTIGMKFDELESDKLWGKFETAVCSAYRVDPIVAMVYSSGQNKTYSNYEEAMRGFTTYTRMNYWNLWQSQIQSALVGEFENPRVEFDTRFVQALQPTPGERQQIALDAFAGGLITRNEGRSLIGFEGTDVDGDSFFSQPASSAPAPAPEPKQLTQHIRTKDIGDYIDGMSEQEATVRWKSFNDLNEKHSKKIARAFAKVARRLEAAYLKTVKAPIDWNKWVKEFQDGTEEARAELIKEVIAAAWEDAGLMEEIGTAYDVVLADAVDSSATMIADSVGTIKSELKELLINNAGATASELSALIKARFDTIAGSRADAIGWTTTTSTSERAKQDTWSAANKRIDDPKNQIVRVWLSARLPTSRSAHIAADGQAEDEDGLFTLNGNKTPHPSGAGLPAEDAVRCHCSTVAVRRSRLKK